MPPVTASGRVLEPAPVLARLLPVAPPVEPVPPVVPAGRPAEGEAEVEGEVETEAVGEALVVGVPVPVDGTVGEEVPGAVAEVLGAGSTTVIPVVDEPISRLQAYLTCSGPASHGSTSEPPETVRL